jgi:alcohol dehydrogenase class IV
MARLVILDPELLRTCPKPVLAASGMDAFTQAVESFVSNRATWFSDRLALKGAALINGSLERVHAGESGDGARDLMVGSYFAGIALSNARLGIVHGLAHPLGIRYHLPHGLACAICLPLALEFNRDAMGKKYARLSDALGADVLSRSRSLLQALGIESPLAGQSLSDEEAVIRETLDSGSTRANPRPVSEDDVRSLLKTLFSDPG